MKFLVFLAMALGFSSASLAQNYYYPSNPYYCRADWDCAVVSTNFKEAARFCGRDPFARGTAMVYQYQGSKYNFKGYGCVDERFLGGS